MFTFSECEIQEPMSHNKPSQIYSVRLTVSFELFNEYGVVRQALGTELFFQ